MKEVKFETLGEDAGLRLDRYLVEAFKKRYSRSYVQKLITEGLVLVNDNSARSHHRLRGHEKIAIVLPPDKKEIPQPEAIDLDIAYEDNFILVVNKPAKMIVHPASNSITGTLVNALLYYCKNLSTLAGRFKPGIVHRLDKDTSGLLVVAKNNKVHEELARQFKERTVKRKYLTLVHGIMQLDRGIIDAPLGRSKRLKQKMTVNYLSKKDALTFYEVLERFKNATLLELNLKTGRTHQVRVHLKHIGYPIIGDSQYGIKKDAPRQMLHAKILGFIHPESKKYVEFNSQIPLDMQSYIENLPR